MAVLAPMPKARETMATRANIGLLRSERQAKARSGEREAMPGIRRFEEKVSPEPLANVRGSPGPLQSRDGEGALAGELQLATVATCKVTNAAPQHGTQQYADYTAINTFSMASSSLRKRI
jgi:hypothetical protein